MSRQFFRPYVYRPFAFQFIVYHTLLKQLSLAGKLVMVNYLLYLIFYIVIFSLFVYSLGLQTMWKALCKGISRFKLVNHFKYLFPVPTRTI